MKKNTGIKAVSLLSGGLDSMLAIKLMLEQGIDVHALNFLPTSAIVSGFFIASNFSHPLSKYLKNGFAPTACTAAIRGFRSIKPSLKASLIAFPKADVFPKFPAGKIIQSGAFQFSCCKISKIIVF